MDRRLRRSDACLHNLAQLLEQFQIHRKSTLKATISNQQAGTDGLEEEKVQILIWLMFICEMKWIGANVRGSYR